MRPLRIGDQLARLESCDACGVLWVERLDEAIVERLERRHALARGVESFTPAERRDMAREMAGHARPATPPTSNRRAAAAATVP